MRRSTASSCAIAIYRVTSLIRNSASIGPDSRPYGGPRGGGGVSYERGTPVARAMSTFSGLVYSA